MSQARELVCRCDAERRSRAPSLSVTVTGTRSLLEDDCIFPPSSGRLKVLQEPSDLSLPPPTDCGCPQATGQTSDLPLSSVALLQESEAHPKMYLSRLRPSAPSPIQKLRQYPLDHGVWSMLRVFASTSSTGSSNDSSYPTLKQSCTDHWCK